MEHLKKQEFFKFVIPDGNVMDFKDEQPEKHSIPKLVIPDGNVIDVNLEQL